MAPLGVLDLNGGGLQLGTGLTNGGFAEVDEELGRPGGGEFHTGGGEALEDGLGVGEDGGKDGVFADLAEPVAGIEGVGLLAVNDGVPVRALGSVDVLGGGVRAFPIAEEEQRTGVGRLGLEGSEVVADGARLDEGHAAGVAGGEDGGVDGHDSSRVVWRFCDIRVTHG